MFRFPAAPLQGKLSITLFYSKEMERRAWVRKSGLFVASLWLISLKGIWNSEKLFNEIKKCF